LVGFPYFFQQIHATSDKAFVLESPPLRTLVIVVIDADRVGLDFAESVEVELTDEGAEVVVLEELRYDVGRKGV
jgi:hypothetical protein